MKRRVVAILIIAGGVGIIGPSNGFLASCLGTSLIIFASALFREEK